MERKSHPKRCLYLEKEQGMVEMTFELDARGLDKKAVVVFEKLYDEEEHLIAREENIDNEDQMIAYKKSKVVKKVNTENTKPVSVQKISENRR